MGTAVSPLFSSSPSSCSPRSRRFFSYLSSSFVIFLFFAPCHLSSLSFTSFFLLLPSSSSSILRKKAHPTSSLSSFPTFASLASWPLLLLLLLSLLASSRPSPSSSFSSFFSSQRRCSSLSSPALPLPSLLFASSSSYREVRREDDTGVVDLDASSLENLPSWISNLSAEKEENSSPSSPSSSSKLLFISFVVPWCHHCRAVYTPFAHASQVYRHRIKQLRDVRESLISSLPLQHERDLKHLEERADALVKDLTNFQVRNRRSDKAEGRGGGGRAEAKGRERRRRKDFFSGTSVCSGQTGLVD